jgi:hypothetical protein
MKLLSVKLILLPIFFWNCASACAALEMDEFVVESQLLGPRKLYVSKSIIRIDCPRESLTIISKKPFSHVTCFNSSSRRICQAESAIAVKELRTLGVLMAEVGEVKLTWNQVGTETLQGVPCTAYKAKVTHTEARPQKADEVDWRKYWVRKDLEVPKAAGDILSAAVGAPNIPGIPQRMEHFGSETDFNIPFLSRSDIDTKKKTLKVIISNKSRKKVTVPDSFFDIPKGYKIRKDFKKVLLHSGGIQSLKDARVAPDFLFESK